MGDRLNLSEMADGVYLAGIYSSFNVGVWILESEGECAIFEMPASSNNSISPALHVKQVAAEKGWKVKYLFLSHPHIDHDASIREFRAVFPDAVFPVHYSCPMFLRITDVFWRENDGKNKPEEFIRAWKDIKKIGQDWFVKYFDIILTENVNAFKLGSETIYMIYAPKHSMADTHFIYRGCWFSGDWWLYEGDPCEDKLSAGKAADSLCLLRDFAVLKNYNIHTVFPSHANNILRNVDFFEIISRTLKYHEEEDKKKDGGEDWKKFDIQSLYYYVFNILKK